MDEKLITWGRAVKARTRSRVPVLWLFTDAPRGGDPVAAARRLPKGLAGVVFRHDGAPGRARLARALAAVCRARRLGLVVAGDARLAASLGVGMHLRGGRWPGVIRVRRGLLTSSAHTVAELRRARRAGADMIFLSPAFPTASHAGAPGLGPIRWARLAAAGMRPSYPPLLPPYPSFPPPYPSFPRKREPSPAPAPTDHCGARLGSRLRGNDVKNRAHGGDTAGVVSCIFALGGLNGTNVKRLPRARAAGAGAIGALGG